MAKKSPLRRAVRCVRRFVKQFGLPGIGMSLQFLRLELETPGAPVVALKLPGEGTVWLRKHTSDKDVFFQIFVIREYDLAGVPQFAHLKSDYDRALAAGETPLIVDCGANIGLASIWFARLFPQARIYSIEPDANNFAMLRSNTEAYANIVPVQAAIWDRHVAALSIVNPDAAASFYQVAESDEVKPDSVPAYTMQEIMSMAGTSRILLAKIDIEGAERALFRSNTNWLAETKALAIELHDWLLPETGSSRNFLVALAQHPFEVVWHHGTMFCVKLPDQETARAGSANASRVEAR